jgi:hypothetical protein
LLNMHAFTLNLEFEMSYRPRPAAKLPLAAGCALAALLSTPLVMAQSEAAPSTLPAHRVVIDSVTGRPRAAEAGEWAEAPAAAQRSAARAAPAAAASGSLENHSAMKRMQAGQMSARVGTIGRRVDPSRLSYTVAGTDANGALTTQCVTGEDAAHKALHGAAQGGSHDH